VILMTGLIRTISSVIDVAARLVIVLGITVAGVSAQQSAPRPGRVYVVHAIDTETRDLNPFVYSQTLMFRDSEGHRVEFTWFALTHESYLFSDRKSATVVFEQLDRYAQQMKFLGDAVGWHYHNADWNNPHDTTDNAGCWKQFITFDGSDYMHGSDIALAEGMLARLIIDKRVYPSVYRSGWTWESAEFSRWLDDVVPFDFSNAAPLTSLMPRSVRDTSGGAYDWMRAPSDWSYYHPDSSDYQKAGKLKRTIFRCFPGHRAIDLNFSMAFKKAKSGENVLVAAYAHSFDDLAQFCRITTSTLRNTSQAFPEVRYEFVTALEGVKRVRGLENEKPPRIRMRRIGNEFVVISNKPLYCFPYGAARDASGAYFRVRPTSVNPDRSRRDYRWTFDLSRMNFVEFAAACVDVAGNVVLTPKYRS
jgi:hypothetical protein